MKKRIYRISAIALALVLVFCMWLPAFAAEGSARATETVSTFPELVAAVDDSAVLEIIIADDIWFDYPLAFSQNKIFRALNGNVTLFSPPGDRHMSLFGQVITLRFEGVRLEGIMSGGGIYASTGGLHIDGVSMMFCYADRGAAVEFYGFDLILSNCSIGYNRANDAGGAIYLGQSATLAVEDTTLTVNDAQKGGAIYAEQETEVTLYGANLDFNSAAYGGGLYSAGVVTVHSGIISRNTVDYEGGGIYISAPGTISLQGGSVTGNTAGVNGNNVFAPGLIIN